MSSLLEQAIIDAGQLRDAALKSAETVVAEKYSDEIKSIMNELLDEADDELGLEEPEEAHGGEEPAEGPVGAEAEVPPAALDGETACPCPDEVEGDGEEAQFELDLDQLARMPTAGGEIQGSAEDFAAEIAGEEEPLPLEENNDEIDLDLEEDIDFSAEDLLGLLEEMEINVAAGGTPSGWLGTPEPIKRDQIDQNLAALKDTEEGEENLELIKKIDELEEVNQRLVDETQEFKNLAENLAEKLKRVNMSNAKLLYINKTLGSTSLNERQKQTIVEAISKANTAEEAKVIFETLQNTVGSSHKRERLPESLSEAVNRRGPAMLVSHPRKPAQDSNGMSSFADRMRKLAGIT